jgi:hypothetical protein
MSRDAGSTKDIAGEPGEQAVILGDLAQLWPPAALSATVADGGALGGHRGADEVRAMPVVLVSDAFTAIALGARTDTNLVDVAGLATGRDEPTTAAEVLEVLAVGLEEAATSPDILGDGFLPGTGYSSAGHEVPPRGPGLGVLLAPPGPSLLSTPAF